MATNVTIRNISDERIRTRTGQPGRALEAGQEAEVDLDDPRVIAALDQWPGRYVVVSGGGSGASISYATATFGRDVIRALPTTPAQIIAPTQTPDYSPLTDPFPHPIYATIQLKKLDAGPGDGYGNTQIDQEVEATICWGSDYSVAAARASIRGVTVGTDETHTFHATLIAENPRSNMWICGILDPDHYRHVDFHDNGLYVTIENDLGDLTGGNATDELIVDVWYVLKSL